MLASPLLLILVGSSYHLGIAAWVAFVVGDGGGAIVIEINSKSVWHYPVSPV